MRTQFYVDFFIWAFACLGALFWDWSCFFTGLPFYDGVGRNQGLVSLISGLQAIRYLGYIWSYGKKWIDT